MFENIQITTKVPGLEELLLNKPAYVGDLTSSNYIFPIKSGMPECVSSFKLTHSILTGNIQYAHDGYNRGGDLWQVDRGFVLLVKNDKGSWEVLTLRKKETRIQLRKLRLNFFTDDSCSLSIDDYNSIRFPLTVLYENSSDQRSYIHFKEEQSVYTINLPELDAFLAEQFGYEEGDIKFCRIASKVETKRNSSNVLGLPNEEVIISLNGKNFYYPNPDFSSIQGADAGLFSVVGSGSMDLLNLNLSQQKSEVSDIKSYELRYNSCVKTVSEEANQLLQNAVLLMLVFREHYVILGLSRQRDYCRSMRGVKIGRSLRKTPLQMIPREENPFLGTRCFQTDKSYSSDFYQTNIGKYFAKITESSMHYMGNTWTPLLQQPNGMSAFKFSEETQVYVLAAY